VAPADGAAATVMDTRTLDFFEFNSTTKPDARFLKISLNFFCPRTPTGGVSQNLNF
jgi:hypothetical protein